MHHAINILDSYTFNQCKLNLNNNGKTAYLMENFMFDVPYMTKFLQNIRYSDLQTNSIDTYISYAIATGSNYITLVLSDSDYKIIDTYRSVTTCFLSKRLINDVNQYTLNKNNKYSDLYRHFFLDLLFNPNNVEKLKFKNILYIETDDIIMTPNINLFYVNPTVISMLSSNSTKHHIKSNTKSRFVKSDILKNIIFDVLVKPDNYGQLQDMYMRWLDNRDESILESICVSLYEQQYVSVYHLNYGSDETLRKFLRIRKKIHKFYNAYGYYDTDIKIFIEDQFNHNAWIDIKVQCLDSNNGDRYNYRITSIVRNRTIDNLITYLKHEIYPSVGRQRMFDYDQTVQYKFKSTDCPLRPTKLTNIRFQTKINFDKEYNNKFENFTVHKIFYQKLSKYSSFCSFSVCVDLEIDGVTKRYLVNIKPVTLQYISKLSDDNKYNEINLYLTDPTYNTMYNEIAYDTITSINFYKTNLYYVIELVDVQDWKCGFDRQRLLSKFEQVNNMDQSDTISNQLQYYFSIDEFVRKSYTIVFNSNYELEEIKKKFYIEKFPVVMSYPFFTILSCLKQMQWDGLNIDTYVQQLLISLHMHDIYPKSKYFRRILKNFDEYVYYHPVDNSHHRLICLRLQITNKQQNPDNITYIIRQCVPLNTQYLDKFIKIFIDILQKYKDTVETNVREIKLYENNWYLYKKIYKVDPTFNFDEVRESFIYRPVNLFQSDGTFKPIKDIFDKFILQCLSKFNFPLFSARYHPRASMKPGNFDFHPKLVSKYYKPLQKFNFYDNYSRTMSYSYFNYNESDQSAYPGYYNIEPSMFYRYEWINSYEVAYIDISDNDREVINHVCTQLTKSNSTNTYMQLYADGYLDKIFNIYFDNQDWRSLHQLYVDINVDLIDKVSVASGDIIKKNIYDIAKSLYLY